MLLQQLDVSSLDRWCEANRLAALALLADCHDIFSLEPGELAQSTDLAKLEIRIVDDEPFKKWFQRIPPPMVDDV